MAKNSVLSHTEYGRLEDSDIGLYALREHRALCDSVWDR